MPAWKQGNEEDQAGWEEGSQWANEEKGKPGVVSTEGTATPTPGQEDG